ncbi:MAG: porin family protein [Nitrospira sp.]|nr:porin family protein [Nitrospira sp.]MDH5499038.1 porin family protein [Nitrospira sp.]
MGFVSLARLVVLPSVLFCCLYLTDIARPAEFGDIELSLYALGSWPRDENVFNQGTTVSGSIQEGFGAGLKVGLFPAALHRVVGLEIDSNAHSGRLSFPNLANGQNHGHGRSDLLLFTSTFNLILRYPGERVRPYVGVGIGWATGVLLNPNIAGRDDDDFGSARAFGHQFLGGTQVLLSSKVMLFAEYRYFSTDYHWKSLAVDFRDHNVLVGVGLRF